MAMDLQEFVRRRKQANSDADRRAREQPQISDMESIQQRLDVLAVEAAGGVKDIDLQLAALLDQIPEGERDSALQRFRGRVQEMQQEASPPPLEMTPQQEALMRQLKEHEQQMIAHMLHEKTREKIRRIFLLNPSLWQQVTSISENLCKRGILGQIQRVTSNQLGQIQAQPGQSPEKKQDKERER
jgi:DNA-binding TFAR19-related protein (PDSD5 family)